MSLEKLTQTGLIHEIEDVSAGPHSSKFCFVLGAGASKTSGIKTGQELVDIWEKEMLERNQAAHSAWKQANGITEKNKYSFYSQYYEERYKKRPMDGLNFLEKMMENVHPNVGYVVLAHLLAASVHNVVITTNFDHLIEDALNYYEKSMPLVIGHESLAHYITKEITRPTIIKIHRDLLFDPKNTAKDVGVLHESWEKALDIVFSEFHPIFIGYAGNDKSLMDYLIKNKEKFCSGKWKFPYWTFYKSDIVPEGQVKEFLEGTDGYYINCNGFDELLCLLGAETGYQMPTEKVFLEDTRIRYHKLCEAFQSIVSAKDSDKKREGEPAGKGQVADTVGEAVQKITSQSELDQDYIKANILHNEGKYDESLKIRRILAAKEPENAKYHDNLSTTLHEMGRYKEAEEESRKAVELEPENARYHDNLSTTLHEMGRYEEAVEESRKATELEPENADYHDSLSTTLHKMGRYEEAEKESRKAVNLEPENASYHDGLGITLHEMGRYGEAEKEARRAVELEPENARYHDSLSTTLHKMGRYDEAEAGSRKAVAIEPRNAVYHNNLGITLHEMKRYEEAKEEKKKAVELAPEKARYHNSLGLTLDAMKNYGEAEKELRKAAQLAPENGKYQNDLKNFFNREK